MRPMVSPEPCGVLWVLTWWTRVRRVYRGSASKAAPPSDWAQWKSAARTAESTAPAPPPPRQLEPYRTLITRRCICNIATKCEYTNFIASYTRTRYGNTPHPPPYLCMKTVFIPRARAIAQACWPPAPPKHANTCWDVSWPLACEGTGRRRRS